VFGVSIRMLRFSILAPAFVLGARAQDSHYVPLSFADQLLNSPPCLTIRRAWEGPNIPCTPFTHQEWLDDLTHWRAERRIRIGYDPARYTLPALRWTQSSFIQPQMMVHNRYFYDPA
jgi:gamma-glutamyl hercynylcysteine S-oxide synthase